MTTQTVETRKKDIEKKISELNQFINLRPHESCPVNKETTVTRVANGWIYTTKVREINQYNGTVDIEVASSMQFVPKTTVAMAEFIGYRDSLVKELETLTTG